MTTIGQWAQCTITAVAPNVATLSITAATFSAGNVTYTYTVTQGSVASVISGGALYVIISGMQNVGNNGHFTATTFGAGTFTVANASGVTESGSSGTGVCPSDSGVGVSVFCSGQSSYFFQVGTNSFGGDGRVAFNELWKMVNNVGTQLQADTLHSTTVSEGIAISVETQVATQIVTAWINGTAISFAGALGGGLWALADSALSSGTPGINTFSVGGPNEYIWGQWAATLPATTPGNSGTKAGSYAAGIITQTVLASDSIPYANGDLHTANANYVYEAGSLTVSTNQIFCNNATISAAYRSDLSPNADQYSEAKVGITAAAATQVCGPAVRMSTVANSYYALQVANNLLQCAKMVSGTFTAIGPSGSSFAVTGDVVRLVVRGSVLVVYKNGILQFAFSDSTFSSGRVGLFGAGNALANGITAWNGGNYAWQQTQSDNFPNPPVLGPGYIGPTANNSEGTSTLTQASITVGGNTFAPATNYAGVAQAIWIPTYPSGGGGGELEGPAYNFFYQL